MRDNFDQSLTIVFGVVVAFLLIAAVNVGNLLLARGAARTTELATRAALGAGRGRLLRQLATEGIVLSVSGAVLGALRGVGDHAAAWHARSRCRISASASRRPLDPSCCSTVAGIVAVVALVVSLLPAWRLSRVDLHPSTGGRRANYRLAEVTDLARHLIVSQLAVSLLLVTLAGLFLRTVAALQAIDPGFEPSHVVLFEVQREQVSPPSMNPMDEKQRLATLYQGLNERLATIPGVGFVGLSWLGLFGGSDLWLPVTRTDIPTDRHDARTDYVSAGYFESVGMRIVRGRSFSAADRDGAPRVAIVNETFVRQRFAGSEPLGQSVTLEYPRDQQPPFTIIGVVRDSKYNDVREAKAEPMIWAPLLQWPLDIRAITLEHAPRRGSGGHTRCAIDRGLGRSELDDPPQPHASRTGRSDRLARAPAASPRVRRQRARACSWRPSGSTACWRNPSRAERASSGCVWRWAPASGRWS